MVTELSGRWQSGPDFLCLLKEQWPQSEPEPNQEEVEKECRKTLNVGAVAFSPTIIDSNRFFQLEETSSHDDMGTQDEEKVSSQDKAN